MKRTIDETWNPIKGYVGLYEISNLGRVKSLKKSWWSGPDKSTLKVKEDSIMNLSLIKGYRFVTLMGRGNKKEKVLVHRLVASAFIPNPYNKPCVNHIDHDRQNNSVDNLEWCTYLENNQHSPCNKIKEEEYDKVAELYSQEGATCKSVGGILNVSDVTIGSILKKMGIKKKLNKSHPSSRKGIKLKDFYKQKQNV
jgi:hypothetical protein